MDTLEAKDFKHGDEHPERPGWRANGKSWLSPEAWNTEKLRVSGQRMAAREWKRLYYVPKQVPKGPPFHGDEDPTRPGWRWGGSQWYSPEAWDTRKLRTSGQGMAEREYDRTHPKKWDDRYGKSTVVNTEERKKHTRENTKRLHELATAVLDTSNHQCAYCGCPTGNGLEHTSTPSYDRVDTEAGAYYTLDTVQLLCQSCNGMKGDIAEHKLLEMTNVSELVKSNIRRYLNGEPRTFKDEDTL